MKKVIALITLFCVVIFLAFYLIVNALNSEKINVLIYGVDGRKDIEETERSDAIILANYNFKTNKLVLTSIPRDSYVKIACRSNSYDKINHSYAYGGESCLNDTVSQLFGLNNVKNLMMNFEDVVKFVDYFGLIELVPNYTFCQSDVDTNNNYCFEKGKEILIDGKQALAYMRNRKSLPLGDINRTENQRQILKILLNKFFDLSLLGKIQLFDYVKENIKTNIELKDFNIKEIISVQHIELNEYTLKGEEYINKYYYYKLDDAYLEKIKKYYI